MDYDYDVVIVGGGPAGSIAAYSIANEGYSCVIVDKKDKENIGNKNCGDALDETHVKILERELGVEPPSIEKGEARDLIKRITIAAGDLNSKLTADTPGYLVDRLVYGQRLLQMAEKAGAEIISNASMRGIIIENAQIVGINYFHNNQLKQIKAKITIDASGYVGAVRKEIPKELSNGIDYTIIDEYTIATYREIIKFKNNESHNFREEIVLLYHNDIPVPGYAWIFSEGEGMLNIGITWVKSINYPSYTSMKKIYHEVLDPYFDPSEYEVIYKGGGNIPMRPNFDSLVVNGAMLCGDAGALADPTTYEGHGPALESGRLAAKAAIQALKKNSFLAKDLWQYNVDVMKYPGGMHTQSYIAQILLTKLKVKGLKYLLDKNLISEQELRDLFQNPDAEFSLWFKIKKLLKMFPRWDLVLTIKKHMDLIELTKDVYELYPADPSKLDEWREFRNRKLKINF